MTVTRRPLIVLATLLLAGVAVVAFAGRAQSQPALPPVEAADLLASVATALESDPTVSGDVQVRADLGLPELPEDLLGDAAEEVAPLAAVASDRRLRVERSGDGLRLAELTDDGERALISDGDDVWLWNSADMTVVHGTVGQHSDHPAAPELRDPLEAARRLLDAVSDTTAVEVARTDRVAGRDVYTLALLPRDDQTLVERVELAVDAEQRLPLAVSAFGAAETPALSIAYTRVDFSPIDPARFAFTPPPGAEVTEAPVPPPLGDLPEHDRDGAEPRVIGDGWSKVLALPIPEQPAEADDPAADVLPFQGTVFSAAETTVDGTRYLLVGAVPLAQLEAAAGQLP